MECFNHRRGAKFPNYAAWWIKQSITRAIADSGRTIRVPVHVTESLRMIRKAQLDASTGSEATPRDISRLTELPLEKVQKLLNIPEDPVSLNTAEEQMAVEQIVDLRTPSLDDVCATSAMQVVARQLVECLSPKETEVIRTASRLPQRPPRSSGRLRHRS